MAARIFDAFELTDFAQAVNLMTHANNPRRLDVERVEILAATSGATVTCRTAGSGTTDRVYNVATGDKLDYRIRDIRSVSNVTRVRVCLGDF